MELEKNFALTIMIVSALCVGLYGIGYGFYRLFEVLELVNSDFIRLMLSFFMSTFIVSALTYTYLRNR